MSPETALPLQPPSAYEANRDIVFMTLPLLALSTYFYGARPAVLCLTAAFTAMLCDHLVAWLRHRPCDKTENSSIPSALVLVLLLLTPTRVLAALLSRFAYFRFRGLTYALTAAAVFVGVRYVMGLLYPVSDLALLGLYLPLLVADPIVLKRYERPQRERVRTALRKGIITSLGYILMLLLISGLREFLGAGALMGTQVMKNALFPMAQLPSGGFILLALVMCVWRAAAASVKQQMSLGAEHL